MPAATDRLLAAVEAIYDTAPNPSLWPSALGKIGDCFDDAGAILEWRKEDATFGVIVSESLTAAAREFEAQWAQHNFKGERAIQSGLYFSGEPVTDRHIGPIDDAYLNHPFQKEFLVKHGLGWFGAVGVSPDPRIAVGLSVQRDFAKPQFSDAELDLVATLGRHVEKSLRLSIRLLDTELANLGLGDALARIGIGVFALDWSARVLFANPVGKSLLGEVFDLVNDHLRVRMAANRAPFEAAMTQMLRGGASDLLAEPRPILVGPTSTDRRFVIYLLPITAGALSANHVLTHTRAIVLAIEQKSAEPPDPAVVRDILGLTLGEARVASLVGSGLPPRMAAERLGIAEDTARNVLKRVFEKLNVSRQSELTALLGRLVLR
ncbi:helix-turn-helix transcriptional regulator [Bradyrhizobium septentrionale]|uniref:Helix-turn-helix transcriptional regulator n=1 Tax=Bradyrhizobium septentrionale TaxID=1404411 RepID=A0A974A078_9BRAD|nr:helix-turn-helix transcriptional regulator [Bradyrhizobium septentrionale]UGY13804.1 helix-turn-helix transcriptional regulator [Bradyrhizobium septentrionale]UGY22355.1 helix-turn-helix transcriptional regulator [Bradyrhizobium septentrionale]